MIGGEGVEPPIQKTEGDVAQTTIEHPDTHGWAAHLIDLAKAVVEWVGENQIITAAIASLIAGGGVCLYYCVKRIIDYKFPNRDEKK